MHKIRGGTINRPICVSLKRKRETGFKSGRTLIKNLLHKKQLFSPVQ